MRKYLVADKVLFGWNLLLTVFSFGVMSVSAVFPQLFMDAVLEGRKEDFLRYVIRAVFLIVGVGILFVLQNYVAQKLTAKTLYEIRKKTFGNIVKRSRVAFLEEHSADYLSALTNDVTTLQKTLYQPMMMLAGGVVALVASIVIIFRYSWIIGLVLLGSFCLTMILPTFFSKLTTKKQEAVNRSLSDYTATVQEIFAGFEVISSFGVMNRFIKKHARANFGVYSEQFSYGKTESLTRSVAQMVGLLNQIGCVSFSAYMVLKGHISPGAMTAIHMLNGTLSSSVVMLMQLLPMMMGSRAIFQKLDAYERSAFEESVDAPMPTHQESIELKDVSYAYPGAPRLFEHLSLRIGRGDKLVLQGASGSGKSTLMRMLLGELKNYEGEILYDGVELKNLNPEGLRQLIAMVHQEVFLFDDTIRNNICLYEDFSPELVKEAVRRSGLEKKIASLPNGLETEVGEAGHQLSGGERQRIALARAFLRHTPIIIMDEGTSALDVETSSAIERLLLEDPNLTLITITHHLNKELREKYTDILRMDEIVLQEMSIA